MAFSGQLHASAALPSKNEPHYPLSGRLCDGRSEEQQRRGPVAKRSATLRPSWLLPSRCRPPDRDSSDPDIGRLKKMSASILPSLFNMHRTRT